MTPNTPEQITEAKRIDLLSYLQTHRPDELIRVGPHAHEYRTKTHSSLVISNGKWRWCREGFGGTTALQYLIKVEGYPFLKAMEELSGTPSLQPVSTPSDKPEGIFELLPAYHTNTHVREYLRSRGISNSVLDYCIQSHRLYEYAAHVKKGPYAGRLIGFDCVFVGLDLTGTARFACMRAASNRSRFRCDVSFSQKEFGFCLPAEQPDNLCVAVFEAPIDALSHATLAARQGERWRNRHRLALAGDSLLALRRFLADHPQITTIDICTDNDTTGKRIAADIHNLCDDCYTVRDHFPPRGKDYNDYLMTAKKERSQIRRKDRLCMYVPATMAARIPPLRTSAGQGGIAASFTS